MGEKTADRVVTGLGLVGAHAGPWITDPRFGEVAAVLELSVVTLVLLTALFGPRTVSDRAFRLLRYTDSGGAR